MKPTHIPNLENPPLEPLSIRVLRISTTLMAIVMLLGFILIVSLLSIAITKSTTNNTILDLNKGFDLQKNEFLTAVTFSPKYTILLIKNKENVQVLRVMSNKTGKVLGNTLISELVNKDSEK